MGTTGEASTLSCQSNPFRRLLADVLRHQRHTIPGSALPVVTDTGRIMQTHSEHTATAMVMPARTTMEPGKVITGSSSSSSAQNRSWWVRSWNTR